ncbi:DUF3857 domain-containing transglutaminase family protein [Pseudoalteromonas neustonica]|uniref:DUF3857 domain-containing transglutaminase family protein n=1 Tax=Pseudoalteromonas neustonica TaxID=1840331 RepID=A0ABU9TWP9_9GAMM
MKWTQLTSLALSVCFLVISFYSTSQEYQIQTADSWVKKHPLIETDIPVNQIIDGTYYLLLDTQINVSQQQPTQRYTRTVMQAVNQSGIDYISQLNLDFDPSYQTLTLNGLGLIRDGQYIDKLTSAQFKVLQRETELANGIYNGSLTLNIIVDDMRVNDKLDYSFTITGRNPVYQHFSVSRTLNWSVPVAQQFMRVLWQKSTPLYINTVNGETDIKDTPLAVGHDYQISLRNQATVASSNQTPRWYSPYKQVFFSELNTWQEVTEWAIPLYKSAIEVTASVAQVADDITMQNLQVTDRIAAALKFSQDEVRYLGLEMGTNSHQPTPASETLELRYGDCKDKTVLLISLLKAMGIPAYPALVNTEEGKRLNRLPPSANQFDHVIVTLEYAGQRYWLDPTISYQTGSLEHLAQPNYGYALIIKPFEQQLTKMTPPVDGLRIKTTDNYIIAQNREQPATFQTSYLYSGFEAINRRSSLARNGLDQIAKDYLEYYQGYFKGLTIDQPMTVTENANNGEFLSNEFYLIDDFWQPADPDLRADFYASEIQNSVYEPDQITRTAPLYFQYPNNIETTIKVKFEEQNWQFDNEQVEVDNPFFYFKKNIHFAENTLTLNFSFSAKQDHIPADQIKLYLDEREKLIDHTHFGIIKYIDGEATTSDSGGLDLEDNWIIVLLCVYLIGMVFFIVAWRIESAKRPTFNNTHFYPVSNAKFIIYSIFTLGLFINYWSYRNWLAIKAQQDSHIMPIARGIFALFFFYSLFLELLAHSQEHHKKNKIMPNALALIGWLLLIVITATTRFSDYATIGLCIIPLIWLPLVNYIQHINQSSEALIYNSKWRIRNIVISIIWAPILFLGLLQEAYLLPGASIVKGEKLWPFQVQFLQRQQLMPIDEDILYFYSDAFFDFRSDGNGITDNYIFSYWQNEQGQLESRLKHFKDITSIEVTYGKTKFDNTVIKVIDTEQQYFLLIIDSEGQTDKELAEQINRRLDHYKSL